jgi:hypothetical protein
VHIFKPTEPVMKTEQGVEVKVDTIRIIGPQFILESSIQVDEPSSIGAAKLNRANNSPCSGGVVAYLSRLEIQEGWPGKSFIGSHQLDLHFSLDSIKKEKLFKGGQVNLDLLLVPPDYSGSTRCMRIPISHGDTPGEWEDRPTWFVGMGLRVLGVTERLDGLSFGILYFMRVGPWFGPLRLFGEVGIGSAFPLKDESVPEGMEKISYLLLNGALGSNLHLFSIGSLGFNLELGYELDYARSSYEDTTCQWHNASRGLIHGPRAALRFSLLPRRLGWTGFNQPKADTTSTTIELFSSLWLGDVERSPTLVIGLGIVLDFGGR